MLKFKNSKFAMTLAELCIVFVVIGIIATVTIATVNPLEKSMKYLYYKTFHTLETAIFNSTLSDPVFPETSDKFCEKLLEYINSNTNSCSIAKNLTNNPSNSDFKEDNVQIVESNGVRLYIAADEDGKPFLHTEEQTSGGPTNIRYYLVYADLNGTMRPNSISLDSKNSVTDIVGFVVTESSKVVPVGPAELDTRYMLAQVVYSPTDSDDEFSNVSQSMSYYNAKHMAWGNEIDEREVMSLNFQNDFPEGSPLKITYPSAEDTPDVDEGNGCSEANSICYIKIDEFF